MTTFNTALKSLTIATRKSPLAMWQAQHVQSQLQSIYPSLNIQLLPLTTQGDQLLDKALYELGGKSLFLKELEQAIVDGKADIAVHSMKDVPVSLPDGLVISTILEREDPRDALVSKQQLSLMQLANGAVIGTASLRRQAQLARVRPDLQFKVIRGNVGTRLAKLDSDNYDAIILAAAGLKRLGLEDKISEYFAHERCLPSVAQGIIGIETRANSQEIIDLLMPLHHTATATRLLAERSMNTVLGGGCHIPVAGHAILVENHSINLRGLVASVDGQQVISDSVSGPATNAQALGESLGKKLLEQGAGKIIHQ